MMREWWQGLGRRERTLVAAAAALALAAALYVVAIEPAWKTRARLGDELPRLRAQAAEVDALALEARQLARRGAASAPAGALRTALEQSLAAAQLRGASVTAADERRLVVSVQATPVTPWLAWLEQAARESRLRVARVQISRTAARGVVDGEVTFERSAP
jgi:general secretion pathway protein M